MDHRQVKMVRTLVSGLSRALEFLDEKLSAAIEHEILVAEAEDREVSMDLPEFDKLNDRTESTRTWLGKVTTFGESIGACMDDCRKLSIALEPAQNKQSPADYQLGAIAELDKLLSRVQEPEAQTAQNFEIFIGSEAIKTHVAAFVKKHQLEGKPGLHAAIAEELSRIGDKSNAENVWHNIRADKSYANRKNSKKAQK